MALKSNFMIAIIAFFSLLISSNCALAKTSSNSNQSQEACNTECWKKWRNCQDEAKKNNTILFCGNDLNLCNMRCESLDRK